MFRPVLVVLLLITLQSAGAPAIDGTLSDKEWTSAWKAKLEGGGEVRLLAEGKFLFVAIQRPPRARPGEHMRRERKNRPHPSCIGGHR